MLRKTLLVIFSLSLLSCVGAPKRPAVTMCVLDVPASQCLCGETNGDGNVSNFRREPISFCDKATAFPPEQWKIIVDYIHAMEDYGKNHCH